MLRLLHTLGENKELLCIFLFSCPLRIIPLSCLPRAFSAALIHQLLGKKPKFIVVNEILESKELFFIAVMQFICINCISLSHYICTV